MSASIVSSSSSSIELKYVQHQPPKQHPPKGKEAFQPKSSFPPDSPTGVMDLVSSSGSSSCSCEGEQQLQQQQEEEIDDPTTSASDLECLRQEMQQWKQERQELIQLRQVVSSARQLSDDIPEDELGLQLETTEQKLELKTNEVEHWKQEYQKQRTFCDCKIRGLEDQLEETTCQLVETEEQILTLNETKEDLEFKIQFWKQKHSETNQALMEHEQKAEQFKTSHFVPMQRELLETKQELENSQAQVTKLQTLLHETDSATLLEKIQTLVAMVEQTRLENERLKKKEEKHQKARSSPTHQRR
eukprot:scaffold10626_cov112-Cylindrotheca_fusiformis.AAC.2